MPAIDSNAAFITHQPPFPKRPRMPATAPWTHQALLEETVDADDDQG
jgi:hypothetical protein